MKNAVRLLLAVFILSLVTPTVIGMFCEGDDTTVVVNLAEEEIHGKSFALPRCDHFVVMAANLFIQALKPSTRFADPALGRGDHLTKIHLPPPEGLPV